MNDEENQKPMTLLFVDDEANILSALKRVFRPEGYKIFTAEGGAQGLELLAREHVDLVVSDMRMPNMDGAEFLAQVAQRWPKTERILLTGFADLRSTVDAVNKGRIYRYVSKPWEESDLRMTVSQALEKKRIADERDHLMAVTRQQNEKLKKFNTELEAMVKARTNEIQQTADMLELAYKDLRFSYVQMIPVFANLIEMREGNASGHGRRVGEMAKDMALRMKMSEEDVQDVYFAALLHDIGKLALPDTLVDKPVTGLSAREKATVAKHPVIGQAALMAVDSLQPAALMIRSHHERFDGKGYPDGLAGSEIPLGARILTVANDFDSLQMGMLVEGTMSIEDAAVFIETNSGSRYDPAVVKVFSEWFASNKHNINTIRELALAWEDLRPDMILSRDLLNKQGILLLSKGHVLDERLIDRIRIFERDEDRGYTIYVVNKG